MKALTFLASVLSGSMAMALAPGEKIPFDLAAKNQNGALVEFKNLKGKNILLFFYPKDETPGCTQEACSIRDNIDKFKAHNTVVFGVSRQDESSHKAFIAKHKLPYDLLVDADGNLGRKLGVDAIPVLGLSKRQSLLIGPDGKVIRFYDKVDPETHAEEVLRDLAKTGS